MISPGVTSNRGVNRVRRKIAVIIVCALVWWSVVPAAFAQEMSVVGPPGLIQVEQILYGRQQEGALLARLEQVERDVYGRPQDGSAFLVRLQRLVSLLAGAEGEVGIKMKLNAIEWAMFQKINEGPSISRRLEQMETAMFGQIQSDVGLVARLEQLLELMWPGGRVYVGEVTIPQGTLVKIELLTEINSEKSKVNDVVRYRVVEDVRIDNQIAIAAGAGGQGHIVSVEPARRIGQDGRVQVDFGTVQAMDSSTVYVQVDSTATERNRNVELAAGASIAGAVLLGPLGLAAGLFVMGQENVIPVGSQFYVEVARDVKVNTLSLVPVNR